MTPVEDTRNPAPDLPAGARLDGRRLAWQAAALIKGGVHPLTTLQAADPIGAWIEKAPDGRDLTARTAALRIWIDAALTLLGAGVPPADDPVRVIRALSDIHAWVTRPPGKAPDRVRVAPGTPGDSLWLRVALEDEETARQWAPKIAARLREVAGQVESATGPVVITDDWASLQDWPGSPGVAPGTPDPRSRR